MALACESRLVDLERAEVPRYTDADQQAEYPGDRFSEFLPALHQAEIRMPKQGRADHSRQVNGENWTVCSFSALAGCGNSR